MDIARVSCAFTRLIIDGVVNQRRHAGTDDVTLIIERRHGRWLSRSSSLCIYCGVAILPVSTCSVDTAASWYVKYHASLRTDPLALQYDIPPFSINRPHA